MSVLHIRERCREPRLFFAPGIVFPKYLALFLPAAIADRSKQGKVVGENNARGEKKAGLSTPLTDMKDRHTE